VTIRSQRILLAAVVAAALVPRTGLAQSPVAGRWEGAITIMGRELGIVLVFTGDAQAPVATIDVPQQGASGLPLKNVRLSGAAAHFELPAGTSVAIFDGQVAGESMSGTFTQGPASGTFKVTRTGAAPAAEPPPPYKQEEVTIASGAVTLAGTLTSPPGAGAHPAVVLITGSGPQNRDEEIFGFKPFRLIADALTRGGLAVLRCDDRGVGGSTGSTAQSTSADFAADVLAEVQFLKSRPDILPARIGVLGHSEGGLVGPLAASKSKDIAFVVMLSGPALTGEKILLAQGELLARAAHVPEEQVKANADVQRAMFAAVRSGTGWAEVTALAEKVAADAIARLPEPQRRAVSDPQALVHQQVAQQVAAVRSPWFKFFLDYDPAPVLSSLNVPVLALFGEKDLQVPAKANRQALEEAFAVGGHVTPRVEVIPGANHLYQSAVTGEVSEYATLEKKFVPGFLELVSGWVRQQAGVAATK
jgi:uncharacterized protein